MTRSTSRLLTETVSLGYADRTVVDQVSVAIPDGQITVVVGPNACGKSTLLKGLARLVRPQGGSVLLDGEEIHRRPTREVAKVLGLLPQNPIRPTASPSPTSSAAAGTRTRASSPGGRRRTTAPSRRRWS